MNVFATLAMPWWHYALRAVLVYAAVLVLLRLAGKRTLSDFSPFDLIVLILLGEAMQNALIGGDDSIAAALLVATTLVAIHHAMAFLTSRFGRLESLVEGEPTLLVRDGRVLKRALARERVAMADLEEALRRNGLATPTDAQSAVLETNGEITVIPKSTRT